MLRITRIPFGQTTNRMPVIIGFSLVILIAVGLLFFSTSPSDDEMAKRSEGFLEGVQIDENAGRQTIAEGSELSQDSESEPQPTPQPRRNNNEDFDMEAATLEFMKAMADPEALKLAMELSEQGKQTEETPGDRDPAIIRGYVTTEEGEDVEGATVDALGLSNVTTSANGFYELEVTTRGQIVLRVIPPEGSDLAPPNQRIMNVLLGEEYDVNFQLSGGWTMEGRVVDEKGTPLSGALITAFLAGNAVSSQSTSDGSFTVEGVPNRGVIQQLSISLDGYSSAMRASISFLDGPQEFVLRQQREALLTVLNSDGTPVTRYVYTATSLDTPKEAMLLGPPTERVTNNEGRTTVKRLSVGDWSIDVTVLDQAMQPTNLIGSKTFTVVAEGVTSVIVEIPSGSLIEGIVLDTTNAAPAVRAEVILQDGDGGTVATVPVDGGGQFRFESISPGVYTVLARQDSLMTLMPEIVQFSEGDTVPFLTLNLSQGGVIFGQVIDETGVPANGALVKLQLERPDTDGRQQYSKKVDSAGLYRFEGLPEGNHYLWVNFKRPERAARTVTLAAGEELEEVFNLAEDVKVTGSIQTTGDQDQGAVTHVQFLQSGAGKRVALDAASEYSVDLKPGDYSVKVETISRSEGIIGSVTIAEEPKQQRHNFTAQFADADIALVYPSESDFKEGQLRIFQQSNGESPEPMTRTIDQERRRVTGLIAGQYRAEFQSNDGRWRGSSEWVSVASGRENAILIEVLPTQ